MKALVSFFDSLSCLSRCSETLTSDEELPYVTVTSLILCTFEDSSLG